MRMQKIIPVLACVIAVLSLSACSETRYAAHLAKQIPMGQDKAANSKGSFKVGSSYKIQGRRYYPTETYNHTEMGMASWYGPGFDGKKTANGEIFNKNELTAAHRTLQLPSIIKVTNLANGRSAILRVNDRGPFANDRILDVSERAASVLGFKNKGVTKIRLEVVADASKEVASVAKSGRATRGYEVAYNQGKMPQHYPVPSSKPAPVTKITIGDEAAQAPVQTASVPSVQSEPLNDVVKSAASRPNGYAQSTGRVFVQAGSFSKEANALKYSSKISKIAPSRVYMTRVNNQPYFRVRLGPYDNSAQAQQVIASLNQNGHQNAVIVTE